MRDVVRRASEKYGHLPFEEARREIVSYLRGFKKQRPFIIGWDSKFSAYKGKYMKHYKYFKFEFLDRVLSTIPAEGAVEFKILRVRKDFGVLFAKLRTAGEIIKAHVVDTIVIPNVLRQNLEDYTGDDLLDYMVERLLRRKKLSRAVNAVNV